MLQTDHFSLSYQGGGFFTTTLPWTHPPRTEETYELIYMTKGIAYMEENGVPFTLEKGDLKILSPHLSHSGIAESLPPTEFYWHHFSVSGDVDALLPETRLLRNIPADVLPEILHLESLSGLEAAEPALLYFLTNLRHLTPIGDRDRLANRILEWVRINASATLTAKKVSAHFGYHPDYISRAVKNECGTGIKQVIDRYILARANDLLDNSTYSVKEISAVLGFKDANLFVNFYKYHKGITPTRYRNRNFKIHMNSH